MRCMKCLRSTEENLLQALGFVTRPNMVRHEHFKIIRLGATEVNIYLRLLDASVLSLHGVLLIAEHEIWLTSGCSLCYV